MVSNESILEIVNFIKSTPEGNLVKMLKDKEMTEVHVRLLIKLAKHSKNEDFIKSFNDELVPKIKLTNAEHAIKERFWPISKGKLVTMGLVVVMKAA